MEGVGLVVPVGEEHMYYAAMNSTACKLTALACIIPEAVESVTGGV